MIARSCLSTAATSSLATSNVVGRFGGWFPAQDAERVTRWKQVVVVLMALVPLSLIVAWLEGTFWPDLQRVPAILIADIMTIVALTYLHMSLLTRALSRWLRS